MQIVMNKIEESGYTSKKSKLNYMQNLFDNRAKRIFSNMVEFDSFFKSIFINAPAGIAICDIYDYSFIDVNQAFCDLLGYTKEELMAKKVNELSSVEIFESEFKLFADLNKRGIYTYRYDKPYIHKDGHTVWCDLTFNRIQLLNEGMEFAVGIAVDISEKLKLKAENQKIIDDLADSEKCYRSLIESIPDATWMLDQNYNTHFVSPNIQSITGFRPEDIIAKSREIWFERIHPEDKEWILQRFNELFDNEIPYIVEYRWLHPKGEYIWINERSIKCFDYNGVKSAIGIYADITERKKSEEEKEKTKQELELMNSDKDKFFNIIAHDLRSPLTGIMQMQRMLADDFDSFSIDEIRELSCSLKNSTRELLNLLENLLHWSMSQTKRLQVSKTSFNLSLVVEDVIHLLRESAHQKEIQIVSGFNCEVFVFADIDMIKTIIRNLISNAIKFTERGGQIFLNCLRQTDMICVNVKDTGIGMTREMLNSIFNLTNKIKRLGTGGEHGSGLGLFLCKEFAMLNDGDLQIKSQTGKGTDVTLCLPTITHQ